MRWAALVALACGGCQIALHVLHVDELPPDAAADAPLPDACSFGAWSTPSRITANSTTDDDDNAAMSPDGQLIVFERRFSNGSQPDLYYATRSGDDFVDPLPMPTNDTVLADTGPFWSPDGTALYFTQGAQKKKVDVVNHQFGSWGTTQDFDTITDYFERPRFSSNALELVYFDGNPADIVHAVRPSTQSTLWTTSSLDSLNSALTEAGPTLTADDLTIYFASDNTGSGGARHIFEAHRARPEALFDPPSDIGDFGTNGNPFGPDISRDDRVMVFSAYPAGEADVYIVTRSCQ